MTQKDTISYNNPNRNKQVDIDKNYYVPAHVKMNVSPLEMEFNEEAQTIRLKEKPKEQKNTSPDIEDSAIEEAIFNMQEEYALFLFNELVEIGDLKSVKMRVFNILSDDSFDCTIKDFFILKKIFPKVDIQV